MTLAEQVLARAAGRAKLRAGDEVWARVDLAVMHDSSGPRRIAPLLEQLGGRLWDPDRIVLVTDHFIPAASTRHAEILSATRAWARATGIRHFYDGEGIMHNLLLERGLVTPGMLVVGADSHTITAGAYGAATLGVGSTELATVLVMGEVWVPVPPTVLVRLEGALPPRVASRDLAMLILKELRADFALNRAVEFAGSAVSGLPVEDRSVLTNQAVEMGAQHALIAPDQALLRHLDHLGAAPAANLNPPSSDDEYEEVYRFDASRLVPLVACPPAVDNIRPAREVEGLPLDRAYLGSCVGARYSDLAMAARVLAGRRVRIPLQVVPATREVLRRALNDGTLTTLVDAGATVHAPGCGACAGLHSGLLAASERCIATATRNFPGRMGSPEAEIYLASPYTVAASAAQGVVTDPGHLEAGEEAAG